MWLKLGRLAELYNYVEVALWPALGAVLFVYGWMRRGRRWAVRRDCFLAAGVLVLFGASDWFEARTDNEWWHPWWLLLWKAACVIALAAIAVIAYRRERLRKLDQ
jgi:hypothetical protein